MTPLDYVKDKKRYAIADEIEEKDFFMTQSERMSPDNEKLDKFYSSHDSSGFEEITQRLIAKAERGEMKVSDDMVFPPTMSYLPSETVLTFMINRASKAKKGVDGNYGFIF